MKHNASKHDASVPAAPTVYDLTEGTQALGNYLSALQLNLSSHADSSATPEIVDRALTQYARIVEAMRALGFNVHTTSS